MNLPIFLLTFFGLMYRVPILTLAILTGLGLFVFKTICGAYKP